MNDAVGVVASLSVPAGRVPVTKVHVKARFPFGSAVLVLDPERVTREPAIRVGSAGEIAATGFPRLFVFVTLQTSATGCVAPGNGSRGPKIVFGSASTKGPAPFTRWSNFSNGYDGSSRPGTFASGIIHSVTGCTYWPTTILFPAIGV